MKDNWPYFNKTDSPQPSDQNNVYTRENAHTESQAEMKRIPRIKFPQRHPKSSSGAASQHQETSAVGDGPRIFFSRSPSSTTVVGKASDQPKRTPVSQEEIEAILLGGCI
ncbi:Uncharacterized protein Fot_09150 [Forsythia ovata]|uniref:Uncharacterized protein n=1 Tax=Forsythia ovata TaxID=205694 RepID=A0ABD1WD68_9LAMI